MNRPLNLYVGAPNAAIAFANLALSGPSQTYDPITISGCNFLQLPTGSDGIFAYGYATDSDIMQNLLITENTFNYGDGSHLPHAAIELSSSEGLITNNTIKGQFNYGIYVSGRNQFHPSSGWTGSTICSNLIKGTNIAGLYTDWTDGYSELNEILATVGAGHVSSVHDLGRIIYSNYSYNAGSGIVTSDSTAWPDLTGVHPYYYFSGSLDIAAFDTIPKNDGGNAQISLVASSHIQLGNDREQWTWSHWCQNNILSSYSDAYCSCLGGGRGGVSYVPLIIEDSGKTNHELGNISHK